MENDDLDVFTGFLTEDEERVKGLMPAHLVADPSVFIDAFGVKVDPSYCPWAPAGIVQTSSPFPRDGYLADGIEFAAVGLALEAAAGAKAFTSVEIGAGWGPWTALMGILADRAGFKDINLVAFEADPTRFESLRKHLALNGIVDGRFKVELHRVAAWWRNETLYWPVENTGTDAGMAAVSGRKPACDYRGKQSDFQKIEGRSIIKALAGYRHIDFLHIDIQGSEWDLISRCANFLDDRVRCMFVGTHSRKIEGDLIEFLRQRGWMLMRERPCRFYPMLTAPTLTGSTYHDGGQFWRNDSHSVPA